MYYSIEGKKLLNILYLTGILLGTVITNLGIKNGLFHLYDFLDYTGYITSMGQNSSQEFISYILLTRCRQMFLFIISILILSPYISFCLGVLLFAFMTGSFISFLVLRFGWLGMVYGFVSMMPHFVFYGIMFFAAYSYIFYINPRERIYRLRPEIRHAFNRIPSLMVQKVFVALLCIIMFISGCISEAYLNPCLIRMIHL